MSNTSNPFLSEFLQFLSDAPWGAAAAAAASGGTNIALDVTAGEAFVASVLSHFFSGGAASTAPTTAAASVGAPIQPKV